MRPRSPPARGSPEPTPDRSDPMETEGFSRAAKRVDCGGMLHCDKGLRAP